MGGGCTNQLLCRKKRRLPKSVLMGPTHRILPWAQEVSVWISNSYQTATRDRSSSSVWLTPMPSGLSSDADKRAGAGEEEVSDSGVCGLLRWSGSAAHRPEHLRHHRLCKLNLVECDVCTPPYSIRVKRRSRQRCFGNLGVVAIFFLLRNITWHCRC